MEGVKFAFYHSLKWGLLCDSDYVCVLEDSRGSGDWCEAGGDHGGRHHLGGHGPGGGLPEPARHPARQPLPRPRLRPVAEQQAGPVHRQPGEAEAPHALLHPALGGGVQQHRARAGAARAQQVEVRTVSGFQLLGGLQNIVMVYPIGNFKKWHTYCFFQINQPYEAILSRFPSGCAETAEGRVHITKTGWVISQLLKVDHALLNLVPPRLRWKVNGSSSQQNNSKRKCEFILQSSRRPTECDVFLPAIESITN